MSAITTSQEMDRHSPHGTERSPGLRMPELPMSPTTGWPPTHSVCVCVCVCVLYVWLWLCVCVCQCVCMLLPAGWCMILETILQSIYFSVLYPRTVLPNVIAIAITIVMSSSGPIPSASLNTRLSVPSGCSSHHASSERTNSVPFRTAASNPCYRCSMTHTHARIHTLLSLIVGSKLEFPMHFTL